MNKSFSWTMRLAQGVSMVLTLGCCAYLFFFLSSRKQGSSAVLEIPVLPSKNVAVIPAMPVADLETHRPAVGVRDIFSPASVGPTGAIEESIKGQLPPHLKIVGILVSDSSQIVIEDTFAQKTYFIDQTHPQDGIKIERVLKDKIIISYQGQEIPVDIKGDQI